MALNIAAKYPGKSNAPSAGYPYGSARNITAPGDGTGTPLERSWLNDLFGLQQALLNAAGIIPSGDPDTVQSSQYLQALRAVLGAVAKTRADMASIVATADGQKIFLTEGERGGAFTSTLTDISAEVAEDPLQGVFVPFASDLSGASGGWVRLLDDHIAPRMFGASGDFNTENETGTNDYVPLQAAADLHSFLKIKLLVSGSHLSASEISVIGYANIQIDGVIFGTGTGSAVISAVNTYTLRTTFSALGYADFPPSTGNKNSTLTVASNSNIFDGDAIMVKNSAPSAYSTSASPLAEICKVVDASTNVLKLDCRIQRQGAYSTGSVYVLDKNPCSIKGNVYGDKVTVRNSVVSVKGYTGPKVNLSCKGNSSAGLLIHSCLRGKYIVEAENLDDNPATDRLGYAVIAYGACKAGNVLVTASDVRHAYTDGVWGATDIDSGHCIGMVVSGVCYSATAAAWDTHPDSDGTVFNDIQAWSGHNNSLQPDESLLYALQIRGSNATVNGLTTDLERCLLIKELNHVNSVNNFHNVNHNGVLVGAVSGANRLYGVVYQGIGAIDNPITQTGTSEHNFYSSKLTTIEYGKVIDNDNYHNCSLDMSKTTLGFPSFGAGGKHTFKHCDIYNPSNLNISTDEYVLEHTTVHTDGDAFVLLSGAVLTAINTTLKAEGASISNAAFASTSIASGSVTFKYAGLSVNDNRAEDSVRAFDDNSSGGTVTVKRLQVDRQRYDLGTRGDADKTLEVGADEQYQRQSATLTADRLLTLATAGAKAGDFFHITRSSSGAYNLNVGSLKALATGEWCLVVYDGSAWRLMAFGVL